jgi:tetratricopeptide (TPR) repeat protein
MQTTLDARGHLEALKSALGRRDRAAVNGHVAALLALRAQLGANWRSLSRLMIENHEFSLAREAIARFVEASGGTGEACFEQISVLARTGRLGEALAALDALPQGFPSLLDHRYTRGTILSNLGRGSEAKAELAAAIDANPLSGQSWLAYMTACSADERRAARPRLEQAARGARSLPPEEAGPLFYALGAALDADGAYDRAFECFAFGAATIRPTQPLDRRTDKASRERIIATFDAAAVARVAGTISHRTDRPIIVSGRPRSGTTLVEQILASHSAVSDGAELGLSPILAQDLGELSAPALDRYIAAKGSADPLAVLYQHLLDDQFGPRGRIVDKSLDAHRTFGLIAAVLPDAPLVWVERDTLDCAWSCFRTWFLQGVNWSWSLDDIAWHFREVDILMAHWRAVLGDRLFVLRYEDLVTEPETWIPRLLAHCGLSFEQQVLEPHKTERVVITSSVMQVREPINRKGLGVAAPYRPFLQPFVDAYRAL